MIKSKSSALISTLSPEIIPNAFQPHHTTPKLIALSSAIIACVYWHQNGLFCVTFNLQTRKILQKMPGKQKPYPTVNSEAIAIKKGNQNLIILRHSPTEFQILSIPQLRLLHKFVPLDETNKSQFYMIYMNNEVITWFDNIAEVFFWELFSTKPSSSLQLPFNVGPVSSQLTNRNLLIMQNPISKQLVFIDVIHKNVTGTAKVEHNLEESINSEDRLFMSWSSWMYGTVNGTFYCEKLTPDLKMIEIGQLPLHGLLVETFLLDGTRMILWQNISKCKLYEMANDKLISYKTNRPKDEQYVGFVQLPKHKKMFCLLNRDGGLMLLRVK